MDSVVIFRVSMHRGYVDVPKVQVSSDLPLFLLVDPNTAAFGGFVVTPHEATSDFIIMNDFADEPRHSTSTLAV